MVFSLESSVFPVAQLVISFSILRRYVIIWEPLSASVRVFSNPLLIVYVMNKGAQKLCMRGPNPHLALDPHGPLFEVNRSSAGGGTR